MLTRRRPRRLPFSPGLLRPIFEGNATVTNTDIPLRSSEDTVWSTYSDTPTLVESDRLTSPRTARVVMEHSERPVSYGIGGAGNLRMSIKLLLFIDRLAFRYPHFPLSLYLVSEHATICPSKLLPSSFQAPFQALSYQSGPTSEQDAQQRSCYPGYPGPYSRDQITASVLPVSRFPISYRYCISITQVLCTSNNAHHYTYTQLKHNSH